MFYWDEILDYYKKNREIRSVVAEIKKGSMVAYTDSSEKIRFKIGVFYDKRYIVLSVDDDKVTLRPFLNKDDITVDKSKCLSIDLKYPNN